ncbi:MAG: Mur ligase domain-containing protein, partial [Kiritimatiellia bacterium]|nr:Mur ligase domain-containing protein [Kiritimatiellia bacterium]
MKYHLIGVGGVGMSSLAQLLLALGHSVSGSDRYYDQGKALNILTKLQLLGVKLFAQNGSAVGDDLSAVVVSSAIEKDNPDLGAARKKGIQVLHRAELLAVLARDKKCIAVTGTAGKTTVTGMIGWTLAELGLDPTVVNGGAVLNWVSGENIGNFRFGHSDIWVLELDESDRSLLNFSPDWAVITNISKDHFEVAEVRELFALFSRQVRKQIIG